MTDSNYKECLDDFRLAMLEKLQANEDKGGWEDCDLDDLKTRLVGEVSELFHAIRHEPRENIIYEAADVANYAMMIAWIAKHRNI